MRRLLLGLTVFAMSCNQPHITPKRVTHVIVVISAIPDNYLICTPAVGEPVYTSCRPVGQIRNFNRTLRAGLR